ncbi:hypothetical protein GOODEAATRI_018416 [Goodea atripinnis]|uniref:Uncharacterized protein n=1 Tax=Goodea atripinnis TaxID=208336 RepID=A0ABV0PZ34_9TELE
MRDGRSVSSSEESQVKTFPSLNSPFWYAHNMASLDLGQEVTKHFECEASLYVQHSRAYVQKTGRRAELVHRVGLYAKLPECQPVQGLQPVLVQLVRFRRCVPVQRIGVASYRRRPSLPNPPPQGCRSGPVVGYDLDLGFDQPEECESWDEVRHAWSVHFTRVPESVLVLHKDIKRTANTRVFPLKSIFLAQKEVPLPSETFVRTEAIISKEAGSCPLCANVMFRRMYFVSRGKLNRVLGVSDLIYNHEKSETGARRYDSVHLPYFCRAVCLDIEKLFDSVF